MNVEQIIVWVSPALIYGVTWVITKLRPLIPGYLVLVIVALLGGALTFVTNLLLTPELVWWQQLLWSLLAVVISQFKIQFGGEKRAEDKQIKADKIG